MLLWVLRDVDDDAGEDWIEDDIWREVMSGWEGGGIFIYIYVYYFLCILLAEREGMENVCGGEGGGSEAVEVRRGGGGGGGAEIAMIKIAAERKTSSLAHQRLLSLPPNPAAGGAGHDDPAHNERSAG